MQASLANQSLKSLYHALRRSTVDHVGIGIVYRADIGARSNDSARARNALGIGKLPRGAAERITVAYDALRARETAKPAGLQARLHAHLAKRYTAEVAARGGETTIDGKAGPVARLQLRERADGLVLLGADGWRYYSSRQPQRHVSLRYLCGMDDNGPWAVRVPGTCDTIEAARAHLEPAEVKKAREAGKPVLRQGDVWVIPARRDDFSDLPERHVWDAATRTLRHDDGHMPLHVPHPARAVVQRTLQMGRSGRRGRAD